MKAKVAAGAIIAIIGIGLIAFTVSQSQAQANADSDDLARFVALMQYIRSEPTPAGVKAANIPVLSTLDTNLSDIYIPGFITPYTGETPDQVRQRLQSVPEEDRFIAVMVESYRLASNPLLLDIVHQLLPLYYVEFFTTAEDLNASAEFLKGEEIEGIAAVFASSDYAIPAPSTTGARQPTPTTPSLVLRYDPAGDDRDCDDFSTWQEAQAFFLATQNDSHGLDPDNDGIACENLPGAPEPEVQQIVVTATPTPPLGEVSLQGEGTRTRNIELTRGLWIVQMQVSGNQDCSFGRCYDTNFVVWIESVDDSGRDLLVNEIGDDWTGSTTLRVGDDILDHPSGRQVVSVDAVGSWDIIFTKQ